MFSSEFHSRHFVGHHHRGRSLRRASTMASNSVSPLTRLARLFGVFSHGGSARAPITFREPASTSIGPSFIIGQHTKETGQALDSTRLSVLRHLRSRHTWSVSDLIHELWSSIQALQTLVSPGPQAAKRTWTRAWPPPRKRADQARKTSHCMRRSTACVSRWTFRFRSSNLVFSDLDLGDPARIAHVCGAWDWRRTFHPIWTVTPAPASPSPFSMRNWKGRDPVLRPRPPLVLNHSDSRPLACFGGMHHARKLDSSPYLLGLNYVYELWSTLLLVIAPGLCLI